MRDAADRASILAAERLAKALRAEDFVGRLGDDVYACLIIGVPDRERVTGMARTVLEAMSAPFCAASTGYALRASIGIARYPADGGTTEDLMQAADFAIRMAKKAPPSGPWHSSIDDARIPR